MKKLVLFLFIICVLPLSSQNVTKEYIDRYKDFAIAEMSMYSIPASITLAQAILESGNGKSRLAKEANNHFGIKCHSNWNGKKVYADDDEKQECFRKYSSVKESYRDHSLFLADRDRYAFLFEYKTSDYKSWARGLKKAGYATNPKYPSLLINLIERYNLNMYDERLENDKRIFFANTYGFPYITGLGLYYLEHDYIVYSKIKTSFLFSSASFGISYSIYNNIYIGSNTGVGYLPIYQQKLVPQISVEFGYNKSSKKSRLKSIFIHTGVQYSFAEFGYKFMPYFNISYLVN